MPPLLISLVSTVQLTRLAHAFAGVANLWFIILWTRAHGELERTNEYVSDAPLWVLLVLSAVLGVGMSAYAGALNDLFDIRRDQTFAPDRPIPSGRMSMRTAATIGFASLIAALLAATAFGRPAFLMCLFCSTAILVWNSTARHVPSLGLLTVAVIYGSHMLMVNLGLRFIWPVLLIMVHATAVHAAVYRLERKRPRQTILTWIGVAIGFVGLAMAVWYQTGHEDVLWEGVYAWIGLIWPGTAALLFILSAFNKVRYASSRAYAAEKLQRYGALWMGIYGVGWLIGGRLLMEALILGLLVGLGILWMVFIRDLGAWIEQPVGYRW